MSPKVKNIIIIGAVGIALVLIYIFFIKKSPEQAGLVSTTPGLGVVAVTGTSDAQNSGVNQEFLSLLLNVKNIKLDTAIFSNTAFNSLHDSSITLTPDGTEGRDNPFAPIGSDSSPLSAGGNSAENTGPNSTTFPTTPTNPINPPAAPTGPTNPAIFPMPLPN